MTLTKVLDRAYDLSEGTEVKAVRHVRTPAGVRRFGQPIGSIIVRDRKLRHLTSLEPEFEGFERAKGSNGQEYDVGYDDEVGKWVATKPGSWDAEVEAGSEDEIWDALDSFVGKRKAVHDKKPMTPKERAAWNQNLVDDMSDEEYDDYDSLPRGAKRKAYQDARMEGQSHDDAMATAKSGQAKPTKTPPKKTPEPKTPPAKAPASTPASEPLDKYTDQQLRDGITSMRKQIAANKRIKKPTPAHVQKMLDEYLAEIDRREKGQQKEKDYGPVEEGDRVIVNHPTMTGRSTGEKLHGQQGKVVKVTKAYATVKMDSGETYKIPRSLVKKNNSGTNTVDEQTKKKPLKQMTDAELRDERAKFNDPQRRSHAQRRKEIDDELKRRRVATVPKGKRPDNMWDWGPEHYKSITEDTIKDVKLSHLESLIRMPDYFAKHMSASEQKRVQRLAALRIDDLYSEGYEGRDTATREFIVRNQMSAYFEGLLKPSQADLKQLEDRLVGNVVARFEAGKSTWKPVDTKYVNQGLVRDYGLLKAIADKHGLTAPPLKKFATRGTGKNQRAASDLEDLMRRLGLKTLAVDRAKALAG